MKLAKLKHLFNKKIHSIKPLNHWKEFTTEEHEVCYFEFIFTDHSKYLFECCHTPSKSWLEFDKVREEKPSYPEFYKRGKLK